MRIGSDAEYLQVLQHTLPYREHPDIQLINKKKYDRKLYIFETDNAPIQLIASNAEQHKNLF